jgi:hypothetical protein
MTKWKQFTRPMERFSGEARRPQRKTCLAGSVGFIERIFMPSPKSGTAGSLVPPATPRKALEADIADPGEVAQAKAEQQHSQSGKYGMSVVQSFKPGQNAKSDVDIDPRDRDTSEPEKSWIAIELLNRDGRPVPGKAYRIELPDGLVTEGTLDERGGARVEGIDPGTCKVTFPTLHRTAWKPK